MKKALISSFRNSATLICPQTINSIAATLCHYASASELYLDIKTLGVYAWCRQTFALKQQRCAGEPILPEERFQSYRPTLQSKNTGKTTSIALALCCKEARSPVWCAQWSSSCSGRYGSGSTGQPDPIATWTSHIPDWWAAPGNHQHKHTKQTNKEVFRQIQSHFSQRSSFASFPLIAFQKSGRKILQAMWAPWSPCSWDAGPWCWPRRRHGWPYGCWSWPWWRPVPWRRPPHRLGCPSSSGGRGAAGGASPCSHPHWC